MLILKTYTIIWYNLMWNAKPTNDMSVNEVGNIRTYGGHKWLSLNPLGEIFYHDDNNFIYAWRGSYKVPYEI